MKAPSFHAMGAHQVLKVGRKSIFQHFMMICHCKGVSCRVSVTPRLFSIRVSCKGVKMDGTRIAKSPRRSIS